MTTFDQFYEVLRLLIGDLDPEGVYQYQDDSLAAAVRGVFKLGRGPDGYTLNESGITPDIPDGDAYAKISYEASLLLVGGGDGAMSYATRALRVTRSGDRKRDLINELRIKIYDIDSGGGVFESYQSFKVWLNSNTGLDEMVEVRQHGPIARVDITGSGDPAVVNLTL